MDVLTERKEKVYSYLIKYKSYIVWVLLALIIWFGAFIRTRNLVLLQDKYLLGLDDPYLYLRYTEYIVEHGKLFAVDPYRFYPLGADMSFESLFLPYFIAYLHKFFNIFTNFTVAKSAILYPVVAFVIEKLSA
mgnify:CR=1 FL=1